MVIIAYLDKSYELGSLKWNEGIVSLPATGIPINLPANVRMTDVGNSSESRVQHPGQGAVIYNRNDEPEKLDFIIDYNTAGINPLKFRFIPGHEEGHLYHYTGNLSALYREALRLGLKFGFFSEGIALSSDRFVRSSLNRRPREVHNLYNMSYGDADQIADVAGLVALVKGGFDEEIIQRVAHEIRNAGFFRTIPEFLEGLGQHSTPYTASQANHS